MTNLSEEINERIKWELNQWAEKRRERGFNTTIAGQKDAYKAGALAEARRALILMNVLQKVKTVRYTGANSKELDALFMEVESAIKDYQRYEI